MPSWGGILKELGETKGPDGQPGFDFVRRKYLAQHHQRTRRAVISYATKWTDADPEVPPTMISVADGDMQGFMEACYQVTEKELDLILHSPGGSLEAAEAIVDYLRCRFDHIRVLVPHAAMSAASIMACAADVVIMGEHSSLGPIDPQFILTTPLGKRVAPAQAIRDQFDLAKKECQDPKLLSAWVPMLQQFGPDLLIQCANHTVLSHDLVLKWLEQYMFRGDADARNKAQVIADWLGDHNSFKSHARHIPRRDLEAKGMKIQRLEDDKQLEDDVLSIFHSITHTFNQTAAVKIIENHKGNAFVNQLQKIMIQQGPPPPQKPPQGPLPGLPQPATPATPAPPFKKKFTP